MAMVDVVSWLPTSRPNGLWLKSVDLVQGSAAIWLFCIHRMNWVYGALVVTSWTCYGTL